MQKSIRSPARETKTSGIEVIPSAKRLIKSLRDMGYDFSQAVADVVDNSIEAHATLVAIDVEFDGDDSWVRITDNGRGMSPEQLREAMRYGAERNYGEKDLGKFGLGLKTASMSQCQCLSVASRRSQDRADITGYSWDLDHIERTNRWEILPIAKDGFAARIRAPLLDSAGTVVLWKRLDRILGYEHPYGEFARKRLLQMCREIEQHLGMVFHKFLTGEARPKKLKILLNGNEVKAWDPFCISEKKTKQIKSVTIPVEYNGINGKIFVEPYILPHQDDFSSPEAFRSASGPGSWNQQQGFYIYRAGRMIQSGGWSSLRAPDEHTKLARVAVSFSPALDEAFKINVAKMRVQMPSIIRDEIRELTASVTKQAREVYDRKTVQIRNLNTSGEVHTHKGASNNLATTASQTGGKPSSGASRSEPKSLTYDEWTALLRTSASKKEWRTIEVVLKRLRH